MKKIIISIALIMAITMSNIIIVMADTSEMQATSEDEAVYEIEMYSEVISDVECTATDEQIYEELQSDDNVTLDSTQCDVVNESAEYEAESTTDYMYEINVLEDDANSQDTSISSEKTFTDTEETNETDDSENLQEIIYSNEEENVGEIETEESNEEALNVSAVKAVKAAASNTSIENYYTKYGDEYFTNRMYETYDKSTKKYNLTYTVTMNDGTVITGNKDDLYAKFGEYPAFSRKVESASELIIYETFMGKVYFVRFKVTTHIHTVIIDKAVVATSTSTGLTQGSHCSICGDVIVKQEVIPTLSSHTGWYNADGSWFFYDSYGAMTKGWLYRGMSNDKPVWYYFDSNGVMQTGWRHINGVWYYFESSGRMAMGWLKINGAWYYLNDDGAMAVGWKSVNGVWYYMNASGVMQTGWNKVGNYWYYMNSSGAMQTGWKSVNNTWYYFHDSGVMATGWLYRGTENGNEIWYYMNDSGAITYGWKQINNTWYFFSYSSGRMTTGWLYRGTENNKPVWYYFGSSGAMQTGWRKINGEIYFLDRTSGRMATGWLKDGDTWYCMFSDGTLMTGWHYIDEAWYYMKGSGAMLVGTMDVDGSSYSFGTNGKLYRVIKDTSNNVVVANEYAQMSTPDRSQLEQLLLKKFDGDETSVICLISWMEGEADYSADPYLGYLSASAVINSILDYPSMWKDGAGFSTMSGWGSYYSESKVRARYDNQNLMSSTLKSIYLALKYPVSGIHNCYGLYTSGMYPTYCYYITTTITAEGEPTAVF